MLFSSLTVASVRKIRTPEKERALLLRKRNSKEALEVKLYAFCDHLKRLADCVGMLVDYAGKVAAPNTQMDALFCGMVGELTNLRVMAQRAEVEAELLDVIRNDPDFNEQAKNRRAGGIWTRLNPLLVVCLP